MKSIFSNKIEATFQIKKSEGTQLWEAVEFWVWSHTSLHAETFSQSKDKEDTKE